MVNELKELVEKEFDIPVSEQRLIFAGKLLKDTDEVLKYGLYEGCTNHLVRHGASKPKQQAEPTITTATPTSAPVPAAAQIQFPGVFSGAQDENALHGNPDFTMDLMRSPEVMPGVSQIIQSNPALLQAMVQNNLNFQSLPPEMRNLMTNPDFVRTMLNPEVMSSMMSGMGQNYPQGMKPTMQTGAQTSQFTNPWAGNVPGTASFAQPQTAQNQEPPSVRFASQLEQLKQMGFYDESMNIQALSYSNGNVNAAVDWLLSRPL